MTSTTLSLPKRPRTFDDLESAKDLNLDDYVDHVFVTRRNSIVSKVILVGLKGKKVQLKESAERVDSYTISRAEFCKFYRLQTV